MNMIVPSTLPWRQHGNGLQVPRRNRLAGLGDDSTIDLGGDFIASGDGGGGGLTLDPFQTYTPDQMTQLNTLANQQAMQGVYSGSSSTGGGGFSAQQIAAILAGGASAAGAITKSLQSPSVVPGSGLVYNPATGQLLSSSGAAAGISTTLTSMMPLILIGVVGFMVVSMMNK